MRKTKSFTLIAMFANIVLLCVLIFTLLSSNFEKSNAEIAISNSSSNSFSGSFSALQNQSGQNGAQAPVITETEAFIAQMKTLADKYNVSALFLQELFPHQVVYKFRGQTVYANVDETLPKHSYNWQNLSTLEDGKLAYTAPDGSSAIYGIDVSKHQGPIDWQKVKDSGVQFVILRAGYRGYDTGAIKLDEYFEEYIQGASAVGLPIGVYFFSQAINVAEAEEEADFILDAIKNYNVSWPVVFDMEEIEAASYRTQNLSAEEVTNIAIAFCQRVKAQGYKPMIYGNISWFMSLSQQNRLTEYNKWFAQYRSLPWYPYDFAMWQYSNTGKIDGIKGDVDLNLAFVDYAKTN